MSELDSLCAVRFRKWACHMHLKTGNPRNSTQVCIHNHFIETFLRNPQTVASNALSGSNKPILFV